MKLTDCSPIVYHVPIVVGDSDRYYTYYIVKRPVGVVAPVGNSEYAKHTMSFKKRKPAWYIQIGLEEIAYSIEDTSHSFIAPEHPEGFDSPEDALEQLLLYRKQVERK
jgi:hypothetical protein